MPTLNRYYQKTSLNLCQIVIIQTPLFQISQHFFLVYQMSCPSRDPKWFCTVQIIMFNYQSFRTGLICFGHFQIIKTNPEKSNLNLDKMIWTRHKLFGPDQNDLKPTKTIWTVQNYFGHTEGWGILSILWTILCCQWGKKKKWKFCNQTNSFV